MNFIIREAMDEDVASLTDLTCQLGYPITETALRDNLQVIQQNKNETIFVAVHEKKVIGWIGIFKSVHLSSGPLCEIGGLVIDKDYHGKGAGKLLVEQCKLWSKNRGENLLRVRSNTIRDEAHNFYYHLGFKEVKKQKVFEINL